MSNQPAIPIREIPSFLVSRDGISLREVNDAFADPRLTEQKSLLVQRKSNSTLFSKDAQKVTLKPISASIIETAFLNTADKVMDIPLERKKYGIIKRLWIEYDVTQTADQSYILPVPYWFSTCELRSSGSDKALKTWYPETTLLDISLLDKQEMEYVKDQMNFVEDGWFSKAKLEQPQASESRTFRMPLLGSPIEMCNLNFRMLKDDLVLRLKSRYALENLDGAPTITAVRIMAEEYSEYYKDVTDKFYAANNVAGDYLDFQRISKAYTLTNAQLTTVELSNAPKCYSPFLLVTFRNLASAEAKVSGNNLNTYYSIGRNAKFVLKTNGDRAEYETSSSLTGSQVRALTRRFFPDSNLLQKTHFYLIPFTKSLENAIKDASSLGGCMVFDGSSASIEITPEAGTACVQTINVRATAASGNYHFVYKGQYSDSLAYNADVAAMKAAFENIPKAKADGLIVTFNEILSADGSFTATFDVANGDVPLVEVVSNNLATSAPLPILGAHASYTTRGVHGITSASSYLVDVYFAMFRQMTQLSNGELTHQPHQA